MPPVFGFTKVLDSLGYPCWDFSNTVVILPRAGSCRALCCVSCDSRYLPACFSHFGGSSLLGDLASLTDPRGTVDFSICSAFYLLGCIGSFPGPNHQPGVLEHHHDHLSHSFWPTFCSDLQSNHSARHSITFPTCMRDNLRKQCRLILNCLEAEAVCVCYGHRAYSNNAFRKIE